MDEAHGPQDAAGLHRIVIVGGGAGGLELATTLGRKVGRKKRADIVLVDAALTHLWKPLLHEVAAGSLNSYQDEINYFAHARQHGFRFTPGRMEGLERAGKRLRLAPVVDDAGREVVPGRSLGYDTLVLAVGSVSHDFGTPGVQEHCAFLDGRAQAEALHRDLLFALLRDASADGDPPAMSETIDVAIVGGGATGVELAAELCHMGEEIARYGAISRPHPLHITLIEAAERILSNLPEELSASVTRSLERLGIRILTQSRVTRVDALGFHLQDGSLINAAIKIWVAGIQAPAFVRDIDGLESSRGGQLVVRPTLQTTRDDDVFAFGDCAWCPIAPGSDRAVPARAQAAHQQAALLAKTLAGRLSGAPPQPYAYSDFGSLVSLSRYAAVGTLMGGVFRKSHPIEGRLARFAYLSLYRMHQAALHGLWRTFILIVTNSLRRVTHPTLKMH